MTTILHAEQVSKTFLHGDQGITALADLTLEMEQGSFVVLVGPSGCGKSTLLNIVAGLLPATSGRISYQGSPVVHPRLDIGYMTQKDTLMPWRTVARNIEMPLEMRRMSAMQRRRKANDCIEIVGLKDFSTLYPHELSGGMLRRASLARLLVADPETLLLDEPFGALDAQLRLELQSELLRLWEASGKTVLFVTHDIEEAIALGDRVVVLGSQGHIVLDEHVTLPRPRDVARIRFELPFVELHRRLWDALILARTPQEVNV